MEVVAATNHVEMPYPAGVNAPQCQKIIGHQLIGLLGHTDRSDFGDRFVDLEIIKRIVPPHNPTRLAMPAFVHQTIRYLIHI